LLDLGTKAVGDTQRAIGVGRPGDALAPWLRLAQLEVGRDTRRHPSLAEVLPVGPVELERPVAALAGLVRGAVVGSLETQLGIVLEVKAIARCQRRVEAGPAETGGAAAGLIKDGDRLGAPVAGPALGQDHVAEDGGAGQRREQGYGPDHPDTPVPARQQ